MSPGPSRSLPDKVCPNCGNAFPPPRSETVYCSPTCRGATRTPPTKVNPSQELVDIEPNYLLEIALMMLLKVVDNLDTYTTEQQQHVYIAAADLVHNLRAATGVGLNW